MKMNARMVKTSLVLIVALGATVLVAGCHSSHHHGAVARQADGICPGCNAETRIMPITGMSYTTHTCSSCRRVSALDDSTRAVVVRFIGGQPGDTVHACDRCQSTEDCPICRRRSA